MSIKKNKNTTRDAGREYSWYQKRFAPNCGSENIVSGVNSSACGFQNTILGDSSAAYNCNNTVIGNCSFACNSMNRIEADNAFAKGKGNTILGHASSGEGMNNRISGEASHGQGIFTEAGGGASHSGGKGFNDSIRVKADGLASFNHSIVDEHYTGTGASGEASFIAGGINNEASGAFSYAEGMYAKASGSMSHSQGNSTTASGEASHTEGAFTKAIGINSHAEGNRANAYLTGMHAKSSGYDGGNSQYGNVTVGCDTADTTKTELEIVGGVPITFRDNTLATFRIMGIGSDRDGNIATYEIKGSVKTLAGVCTLATAPVVTELHDDFTCTGMTVGTDGISLIVYAEGIDATQIRWTAFVEWQELLLPIFELT